MSGLTATTRTGKPLGAAPLLDNADVQLSEFDARKLTAKIKTGLDGLWDLVKAAYVGRAWLALGYESWDAYCTGEFGTSRLTIPREDRAGVIGSLRQAGLSIPAIATATGLGYGTVQREAAAGYPIGQPVTGTDGKTYRQPKEPKPKAKAKEPSTESSVSVWDMLKAVSTVAGQVDQGKMSRDHLRGLLAARDKLDQAIVVLGGQSTSGIAWDDFDWEAVPASDPLPAWDECVWDEEAINGSDRLQRMADLMIDTLNGVKDVGVEGQMLNRVGQSVFDLVGDENKARGVARLMHSLVEFGSAYHSQVRV